VLKASKNRISAAGFQSDLSSALKTGGMAAGTLASLGLFPAIAKAQAVIDVAYALDVPVGPVEASQSSVPNIEVKTRAVGASAAPVVTQLAQAFEQEAAIAQASQNNFPLIAVSAPDVEEVVPEVVPQVASEIELDSELDAQESSQESEPQTLFQADSALIAIAPPEETQAFDTIAPLIAVVANPDQAAEPLDTTVPQLALASETDESEAENARIANWLAFAPTADENADSQKRRALWLARLLSANDEQAQETIAATQLALNPSLSEAQKTPTAWMALTPIERAEPSGTEVAVVDSSVNSAVESYDVTGLQQVAITPTDLASADETAVSVGASEIAFLSPENGAFLDVPATSVVLRFPVGAAIALLANGQIVDASLVGRTETNSTTQLRTQTWYGVPLAAGENLLEVISTETGNVLQRLSLTVRGLPEKLVLLSPQSIPSDGRSTANISGQLIDAIGNISRWDSVATLQTSDGEFLGADYDPDMPGFQVEIQRGEFVAELQSSLQSHLVQLQANANGFDAFSQIQFTTPQRPELISGVVDIRLGARGTDFYDSYREFLPVEGGHGYSLDVDASVFATGNLGEWLYTGAYNSDRPLNEDCRGASALFRASSDCSNQYPTYGDDSQTDVTAPSLDSVYLRLERNSPSNNAGIDYAMWGDFNTEEFATASQLFTSTSRQFHGFKANYNFGNLALTGLYANNVQGFQRDTIAPDGTSGFYFTSERNLVPGSENVFLELEELERPGTVLERQPLARGADYEIDYDRGTLLFSEPVTRTAVNDSGQLLVRRIVASYQHEDGGDTDVLAARAQYNFSRQQGQESWLGASYFSEDQGTRDFTLYGADAQISLGDAAKLTAEIAQSSSSFINTGDISGSAYRLELDGDLGSRLSGQAYFRSTEAGFSNLATTSFVPGQTRYGARLAGQLGSTTSLRAQFDHEDNSGRAPQVITDVSQLLSGFGSASGEILDNSLTTYSLGLSQRIGRSSAEVDWIHRDRQDRISTDSNISSDQIRSRVTTPITDKLTLVAQNELNISNSVDPIYPSRTLVGLNWEVMPWLNVSANQIFYGGGGNSRGNATSLDVTGEHTFASDTTLRGRVSTVDGRQIGGTIGLEQGINLAPGLNLDLAYEKVFSTFGNETAASTQFSQPYATGSGAAALGLAGGESYSIGLSYTDNPDFQASTRFEHRSSATGSNTVFNLSALGRISPEFTLLGDYRLAHTANQNISGLGTSSLLKLGMAYRDPDNDRFNALLRYEHRLNPNSLPTTTTTGTSTDTQEHLFAVEAIYAPNWRWELYGKYALRHSRTAINTSADSFSSGNTTQLAQARATYRLGYRWDVVGEARWLGGSGFSETGFSVEGGYYPLPDLRISAGYSGGATDTDFGENRSDGGFYIGMTAKLSGLLNGFGTRPNDPPQQRESVLEVSQETTPPVAIPVDDRSSSLTTDEAQGVVQTEAQATSESNNYPSATEL
jgi:hypothetical protein